MVESTIEPEELYVDIIENGRVRVLCRWNIASATRTDDNGDKTTMWVYDEAALWWTLPYASADAVLDTPAAIIKYLESNKAEVMSFAKGSKVSIKNTVALTKARADYRKEKNLADAVVVKAKNVKTM